jgi:hypothetical protein
MTLFEFKPETIEEVKKVAFSDLKLTERGDLQRPTRRVVGRFLIRSVGFAGTKS